jgi:hypothetical protein
MSQDLHRDDGASGTFETGDYSFAFLGVCLLAEHDVVLTLGQDGLVANCAKYAGHQPIIGDRE